MNVKIFHVFLEVDLETQGHTYIYCCLPQISLSVHSTLPQVMLSLEAWPRPRGQKT